MSDPKTTEQVRAMLKAQSYIADDNIVMAIHLAIQLQKPLLVEGPAGVGKTDIARAMAHALETDLIRLQCYEGLDANTALYEWNYPRQLLAIKMMEASDNHDTAADELIFTEKYLLKRPLLQAITHERPPVLLIDELDRADDDFESFLLELLSEWQITIPELGTIRAEHIPHVIITGNRSRDLSDAVRRRCLYLWIDYPSLEKELAIIREKFPDVDEGLANQACRFMQAIRKKPLEKIPGIAETCDWIMALTGLGREVIDAETLNDTAGVLFKTENDMATVQNTHGRQVIKQLQES